MELVLSMLKMAIIRDGWLLLVLAGVLGKERSEPSCRWLKTAEEMGHLKTLSSSSKILSIVAYRRMPLFSSVLFGCLLECYPIPASLDTTFVFNWNAELSDISPLLYCHSKATVEWLKTTEIHFLPFLEARSPRSRSLQGWFLLRLSPSSYLASGGLLAFGGIPWLMEASPQSSHGVRLVCRLCLNVSFL